MTHTRERLVTAKELSHFLHISERHLWNLKKDGRIPSIHIGRSTRFVVEEVLKGLKDWKR